MPSSGKVIKPSSGKVIMPSSGLARGIQLPLARIPVWDWELPHEMCCRCRNARGNVRSANTLRISRFTFLGATPLFDCP
jgi:hypothetical protein